jgi:hypothetical protein
MVDYQGRRRLDLRGTSAFNYIAEAPRLIAKTAKSPKDMISSAYQRDQPHSVVRCQGG